MRIKTLPLSEIRPYHRNPRRNEGAVAKVAGSIEAFGWRQPILVDGEHVIIAGHTRYLAAQQLGLDKAPVIVAADMSPEQAKAYRIADNRTAAEATWDFELLRLELDDLQIDVDAAALFPTLPGLGFDEAELAELLGHVGGEDFPELPDGEGEEYQQMTFVLHRSQVEGVREAIELAKRGAGNGGGEGSNRNSNGNALVRICAEYLRGRG